MRKPRRPRMSATSRPVDIQELEAEIAALDQVIEDAIGQDKDLQTRYPFTSPVRLEAGW